MSKILRLMFLAALIGLLSVVSVRTDVAQARECTRHAFSVNDYGIEVPRRDAQELLDKAIATWASERGITSYKVGEKTVTCEKFLDFIVFDEHTCRAEAQVCW